METSLQQIGFVYHLGRLLRLKCGIKLPPPPVHEEQDVFSLFCFGNDFIEIIEVRDALSVDFIDYISPSEARLFSRGP